MQELCNSCGCFLILKNADKFKRVFTCRKPSCINFGRDVFTQKIVKGK